MPTYDRVIVDSASQRWQDFLSVDPGIDMTHGCVNYAHCRTWEGCNLLQVGDGGELSVHTRGSTSSDQGGIPSIRLRGKSLMRENRLAIIDVRDFPSGPHVWPAWWFVGNGGWPQGGEIDVLEYAMDASGSKPLWSKSSFHADPRSPCNGAGIAGADKACADQYLGCSFLSSPGGQATWDAGQKAGRFATEVSMRADRSVDVTMWACESDFDMFGTPDTDAWARSSQCRRSAVATISPQCWASWMANTRDGHDMILNTTVGGDAAPSCDDRTAVDTKWTLGRIAVYEKGGGEIAPPAPEACERAKWCGGDSGTCREHVDFLRQQQGKSCEEAVAQVRRECPDGSCDGCSTNQICPCFVRAEGSQP
jgi:hypothetical protein